MYTIEFYSALRKNKVMKFAGKQMEVENSEAFKTRPENMEV